MHSIVFSTERQTRLPTFPGERAEKGKLSVRNNRHHHHFLIARRSQPTTKRSRPRVSLLWLFRSDSRPI